MLPFREKNDLRLRSFGWGESMVTASRESSAGNRGYIDLTAKIN